MPKSKFYSRTATLAGAAVVVTTLAFLKNQQNYRFMDHDLKMHKNTDKYDADLDKIRKKLNLTDKQMQAILSEERDRYPPVENVMETNPGFQHKRTPYKEQDV